MEYQGYRITLNNEFAFYEIHAIGKGALPKTLQGSFMSTNLAKRFIDGYINTKKPIKE